MTQNAVGDVLESLLRLARVSKTNDRATLVAVYPCFFDDPDMLVRVVIS